MKRKIIHIDEELCDGCGLCIPDCPEGAIRLVDGKARLAGEQLCDGLGACLGRCPRGAIRIEEREAEAYDERQVMEQVAARGEQTLRSHLEHLREHGQHEYLREAQAWLEEKAAAGGAAGRAPARPTSSARSPAPAAAAADPVSGRAAPCGCPGARSLSFAQAGSPARAPAEAAPEAAAGPPPAGELSHWPVQLHLLSPRAPHFQGADLLLCADCVAYALGDFHRRYLKGRTLAIACPKLDEGQEIYADKLQALVDEAGIHTLTVVIMEVPCCGGLLRLAQAALARAKRKVPLKVAVVGIQGQVLQESRV